MDIVIEIKQLLLEFICEWEQKNDSSLILDFHSFECNVINQRIQRNNMELYLTLLIDAPFIPNNVFHIHGSRHIKLPSRLPESLKILSMELYKYSTIPELPNTLEELYISGSDILIHRLPDNLRVLNCFGSLLTEELPQLRSLHHLETLTCCHSNLRKLPQLPITLKILNVSNNALTEIPELPECIERLDVSYNSIRVLPNLPESLKIIYCSNNLLKKLPKLPTKIESITCDTNALEELPICPPSLRFIMYYSNKFQSPPVIPDTVLEYVGGEYGNRILSDNQ